MFVLDFLLSYLLVLFLKHVTSVTVSGNEFFEFLIHCAAFLVVYFGTKKAITLTFLAYALLLVDVFRDDIAAFFCSRSFHCMETSFAVHGLHQLAPNMEMRTSLFVLSEISSFLILNSF